MNIEQRVTAVAVELIDVEYVSITPSMSLKSDLGMDSLDLVEFIMDIEDEFDIEIYDEVATTFNSIGDVIDYVTKATK